MAVLVKPSPGNRTQGFVTQATPGKPVHLAVDYGWGNGTQVVAAAAGTISYDWSSGYGHRLTIDHGQLIGGKHTVTRYAHLSIAGPRSGSVAQREAIGHEGSSGDFADSTHLHFELLLDGVKANPELYYTTVAGNPGVPITPDRKDATMFQARHPGGAIAVIGELTYQPLNLDQYNNNVPAYGPYIQFSVEGYAQQILDVEYRSAVDAARKANTPISAINRDAIAAKVEQNIADDFQRLSDEIAEINDGLGTPGDFTGPTLEQIDAADDDEHTNILTAIADVPRLVVEELKKPGN